MSFSQMRDSVLVLLLICTPDPPTSPSVLDRDILWCSLMGEVHTVL